MIGGQRRFMAACDGDGDGDGGRGRCPMIIAPNSPKADWLVARG